MSATLITADLHLNDNPRDAYRLDWVYHALPSLVKTHKVDRLLILGDIADEKDRHGDWLVNFIVEILHKLARLCPIVILRGNHDYVNPEHPFFAFTNRLPNITWINKPKSIGSELFLPHTRNWQEDWKLEDFSQHSLVYAHNTFHGAHVGHGKKLSGIPANLFSKATKIYSGDIHIPQTIGPVTYVGAPYTIDFGDEYEPRVLVITRGIVATSIPLDGPQKRLVMFKNSDHKNLRNGDILKVLVDVNDPDEWPALRDKVRQWGQKHGYVINKIVPNVVAQQANAAQRDPRMPPKHDNKLMQEYAERVGFDSGTLKVGLEIKDSCA